MFYNVFNKFKDIQQLLVRNIQDKFLASADYRINVLYKINTYKHTKAT